MQNALETNMTFNPENDRDPIPAAIRRRVLVEAGHRCAIPTCRHIEVEIHHIVPWAQCRVHEYENLIALCPNCHRRADRQEIDRKALKIYKANLRFIHDKYSQLEMDILFDSYQLEAGKAIQWPPFLNVLIRRLIESGYVNIVTPSSTVHMMGMQASPNLLTITEKGREFIRSLGLEEF